MCLWEVTLVRGSEIRIYGDVKDLRRLFELHFLYELTCPDSLSDVGCAPISSHAPSKLERYLRTTHPQADKTFVLTTAGVEIVTKNIKMADGSGIKIATDQLFNPDAVFLRLGGELPAMKVIIANSLSTTGETALAKDTFKRLKKLVVSRSVRVRESYVMPNALEKLRVGWRLTPCPAYSRSEDVIENA